MEHRLILHPTSIVGSLIALVLGTVSHGLTPTLLGGLGGLVIMLVFYFFGVLFARIRARRMRAKGMEADDEEALGQGDVILVTRLGFLVGWPLIWFLIIVSTLLGGIVSLFLVAGLLITRRYNTNALMVFIPYGPYFIVGAALIVYFPNLLRALLPN
jgi:prepilin signal peptidase PulO-like enzyme (type II secretory pathway)